MMRDHNEPCLTFLAFIQLQLQRSNETDTDDAALVESPRITPQACLLYILYQGYLKSPQFSTQLAIDLESDLLSYGPQLL